MAPSRTGSKTVRAGGMRERSSSCVLLRIPGAKEANRQPGGECGSASGYPCNLCGPSLRFQRRVHENRAVDSSSAMFPHRRPSVRSAPVDGILPHGRMRDSRCRNERDRRTTAPNMLPRGINSPVQAIRLAGNRPKRSRSLGRFPKLPAVTSFRLFAWRAGMQRTRIACPRARSGRRFAWHDQCARDVFGMKKSSCRSCLFQADGARAPCRWEATFRETGDAVADRAISPLVPLDIRLFLHGWRWEIDSVRHFRSKGNPGRLGVWSSGSWNSQEPVTAQVASELSFWQAGTALTPIAAR